MIVDALHTIYVWFGTKSKPAERTVAMQTAKVE